MARKSRKSTTARERRRQRAAANQPQPATDEVNFAEEYRYVVSDLKRFGVLAVAMFATLIVLALTIG